MVFLLLVVLLLPGVQAVAGAPPAQAAALSRGVVTQPVVNMYSRPTEDSDVVSQAIYASHLNVVEDQGEWIKVNTPDDYLGWMRATAVRRIGEADRVYGSSGRVGQVRSMFCHLYREPDVTKHAPLLTVPFETRLEIADDAASAARKRGEERWLQARLPDDRTAWVQRGDLVFDAKPLTIWQAIELAHRFMGLPYTWGGTSSFGYDCSGFMQMVMRSRGVEMPRDAGPQAEWIGVRPVARKRLRPGDLLYFGSSPKRITHTGMYIGRGRFIHATTYQHPVIQISRLRDQHWTKLLVAMRRAKAATKQTALPAVANAGETPCWQAFLPAACRQASRPADARHVSDNVRLKVGSRQTRMSVATRQARMPASTAAPGQASAQGTQRKAA